MLQEEGVETVMKIMLKMLCWAHLTQHITHNLVVITQNVIKFISGKAYASLKGEILSEREATKIIALHNIAQLRGVFTHTHHRRTGKHDF